MQWSGAGQLLVYYCSRTGYARQQLGDKHMLDLWAICTAH